MSDAVSVFKALADETRLRILHLLAHRELCVCQLVKVLGLGQSKVSRHLSHLKNAGLVQGRRQGLWIHYSLASADGDLRRQVIAWLSQAARELPCSAADREALAQVGSCGDLCPSELPEEAGEPCVGVAANC